MLDRIAKQGEDLRKELEAKAREQAEGLIAKARSEIQQEQEKAVQDLREHMGDFYVVEADTPGVILERIITLVRDRIPARFHLDPLRDVQILSPTHRAELGVQFLNQRIGLHGFLHGRRRYT